MALLKSVLELFIATMQATPVAVVQTRYLESKSVGSSCSGPQNGPTLISAGDKGGQAHAAFSGLTSTQDRTAPQTTS